MNAPGDDDEILPTSKTVLPPENPEGVTHKVELPDGPQSDDQSAAALHDQWIAAPEVTDHEARSAAVTDREARSAAVADREARSTAVTDREARSAAVIDQDVVLQGNVAVVPLIDVLGLLSRQGQTGVLEIESSSTVAGVTLQRRLNLVLVRGLIAQATGIGFAELRLGRFVMEQDGLTQEEIDALCDPGQSPQAGGPRRHGPGPVLMGQRLCDVGYLSRDERRRALRRQTEELFYEALRLQHGRFRLRQPEALPEMAVDPGHGAALMLDIGTLLLEGYRRAHDWHMIEEDLTAGAMYLRVEQTGEGGPDQWQSIAERDAPRLSIAEREAPRLSIAERDAPRLSIAEREAPRLSIAERDAPRLSIAERDAPHLSLTDKEQRVLGLCTGHHGISEIAQSSDLPQLDVARILRRLQAAQMIRRRLPPAAVW